MRFVYFAHSVTSCWNNGNAHFQRGILGALQEAGHSVLAAEPLNGWSRENLLAQEGADAEAAFDGNYPDLKVRRYRDEEDLPALLEGADVVVVHEWSEPAIVAAIGQLRNVSPFLLLFHDTHHRAVSDPDAIRHFDLTGFDGILAFGEALASIYRSWGWGRRVHVWHEAADTRRFAPPDTPMSREGAIWIGNWGDDERTAELETFLLAPSSRAGVRVRLHGVRYSQEALSLLEAYGASYEGWAPNARVPALFARSLFTVHVPRRYYSSLLPGIPTIRMFEALACGIPLISAPWQDSERLFEAGRHFLAAADGEDAERHMRTLISEPELRRSLAAEGLAHVREHHSCERRAEELLSIVASLRSGSLAA